jgi:outer membrane protein TolC
MAIATDGFVPRPLLPTLVLLSTLLPAGAHAADESMASLPTDPDLAELIRQSLAARPELQAVDARARAEKERVPQAEAFPAPVLSFGIQNDGFTSIEIGSAETSFLSIMLAQTLPWPGKRALRGEVAGLGAEEARTAVTRAQLSTEADVRRAYVDLLLARGRLALLDKLALLWQKSAALAKARYEVGGGPQSDMLRAQLELVRLQQRRLALAADERTRLQALNRLRGHPLDEAVATNVVLPDLARPLALPAAEEVADAEARSPELAGVRVDVRRADRGSDLARKDQYPDFTVSAGVMVRGAMPPMWQLGLAIDLPILWGRTRRAGAIAESDLRATASRSSAEAVLQILRQRVAERHTVLETLLETERLYRDGLLIQSNATVDSTLAQYRVGKVTFASVFEAIAGYIGDEDAYLQTLADLQRLAIARAEVSVAPTAIAATAGMGAAAVPGGGAMGAGAVPAGTAGTSETTGAAPSGSMSRM